MSTSPLLDARRSAAEASAGISSDVIYSAILQQIVIYGCGGDVLDFGAGQGQLSTLLMQRGHFSSVTAVDIMDRPLSFPQDGAWLTADLNDPVPAPSGSFHTIVAAEVIEHLENPRAVAREWARLLRPGGRVIMSTPNSENLRAWIALLIKGHFWAFVDSCYPAHITALLRKDIARVFGEAGLSLDAILYTKRGGIPGWPSVSWQDASLSLCRGRWFSDNMVVVATKSAS